MKKSFDDDTTLVTTKAYSFKHNEDKVLVDDKGNIVKIYIN